MRLIRVHIVGPDIVLTAGTAHRRALLHRVRKLRDQIVPADSGPCQLTCFAERLRVTDSRSAISLAAVMTTTAQRARPFRREHFGIHNESGSRIRDMFGAGPVTAFAPDI